MCTKLLILIVENNHHYYYNSVKLREYRIFNIQDNTIYNTIQSNTFTTYFSAVDMSAFE